MANMAKKSILRTIFKYKKCFVLKDYFSFKIDIAVRFILFILFYLLY